MGFEVQHHAYAILKLFGALAETPESIVQSLNHRDIFLGSSFGDCMLFELSTFATTEALKKKANQTLWSLIVIVGDERRENSERDTGRTWYKARRKVLVEHLEKLTIECEREELKRL